MKPRPRAALLVALAVAQLAVPAWAILSNERILRHGETFRFRAVPVDPYDPFRGRYVALRLAPNTAAAEEEEGAAISWGDTAYAPLGRDAEGFATLGPLRREPPPTGAFLTVEVTDRTEEGWTVELPFDRYYLRDDLAPDVERAFFALAADDDAAPSWLEVRVLAGRGVGARLYVGGRPVG